MFFTLELTTGHPLGAVAAYRDRDCVEQPIYNAKNLPQKFLRVPVRHGSPPERFGRSNLPGRVSSMRGRSDSLGRGVSPRVREGFPEEIEGGHTWRGEAQILGRGVVCRSLGSRSKRPRASPRETRRGISKGLPPGGPSPGGRYVDCQGTCSAPLSARRS